MRSGLGQAELLEARCLLAAGSSVQAAVVGDQIVIHGTNAADTVAVAGYGAGDYVVMISGQSNPILSGAGVSGVQFYGYDGDDIFHNDTALFGQSSGGRGDDIVLGGSGRDRLFGSSGDDEIRGRGGNDDLFGGSGDDYVYGDVGNDRIYGEAGFDRLYAGDGNDIVEGGGDGDVLIGNTGINRLYGGAANDIFYGGTGLDAMYGGDGNDKLYGLGGNDQLFGENGDDLIEGGDGDDYLSGGDGDDTLKGDAGHDTIYGGDGHDVVFGGDGHDRISAGDGHDWVNGEHGDDIINGGLGDDRLFGLHGFDFLAGSLGDDQLFGGSAGYTTNQTDRLYGQEGDDELHGDAANDYLIGGDGDDWLHGHGGHDAFDGGTGHDIIFGGVGHDRVHAGDGNDWVNGEDGDDVINGGTGRDRIFGLDGDDTISGAEGDDTIFGGNHDDRIHGQDGNDHLEGQGGVDIISGGSGNDLIYGHEGDDIIAANEGDDIALGGDGDDLVLGGDGDDQLFGQAGDDELNGELGEDIVWGHDSGTPSEPGDLLIAEMMDGNALPKLVNRDTLLVERADIVDGIAEVFFETVDPNDDVPAIAITSQTDGIEVLSMQQEAGGHRVLLDMPEIFSGTATLDVRVTDSAGLFTEAEVDVNFINYAPTISAAFSDYTIWAGGGVDIPLDPVDPEGEALTYTVEIDAYGFERSLYAYVEGSTLVVGDSGPTDPIDWVGDFYVTVTATDPGGLTDTLELSVTAWDRSFDEIIQLPEAGIDGFDELRLSRPNGAGLHTLYGSSRSGALAQPEAIRSDIVALDETFDVIHIATADGDVLRRDLDGTWTAYELPDPIVGFDLTEALFFLPEEGNTAIVRLDADTYDDENGDIRIDPATYQLTYDAVPNARRILYDNGPFPSVYVLTEQGELLGDYGPDNGGWVVRDGLADATIAFGEIQYLTDAGELLAVTDNGTLRKTMRTGFDGTGMLYDEQNGLLFSHDYLEGWYYTDRFSSQSSTLVSSEVTGVGDRGAIIGESMFVTKDGDLHEVTLDDIYTQGISYFDVSTELLEDVADMAPVGDHLVVLTDDGQVVRRIDGTTFETLVDGGVSRLYRADGNVFAWTNEGDLALLELRVEESVAPDGSIATVESVEPFWIARNLKQATVDGSVHRGRLVTLAQTGEIAEFVGGIGDDTAGSDDGLWKHLDGGPDRQYETIAGVDDGVFALLRRESDRLGEVFKNVAGSTAFTEVTVPLYGGSGLLSLHDSERNATLLTDTNYAYSHQTGRGFALVVMGNILWADSYNILQIDQIASNQFQTFARAGDEVGYQHFRGWQGDDHLRSSWEYDPSTSDPLDNTRRLTEAGGRVFRTDVSSYLSLLDEERNVQPLTREGGGSVIVVETAAAGGDLFGRTVDNRIFRYELLADGTVRAEDISEGLRFRRLYTSIQGNLVGETTDGEPRSWLGGSWEETTLLWRRGRTLYVVGREGRDILSLRRDGSRIVAAVNDPFAQQVFESPVPGQNDPPLVDFFFAADSIDRIVFRGEGGNDELRLEDNWNSWKPVEAYGGAGVDTLEGTVGVDRLNGGAGRDLISLTFDLSSFLDLKVRPENLRGDFIGDELTFYATLGDSVRELVETLHARLVRQLRPVSDLLGTTLVRIKRPEFKLDIDMTYGEALSKLPGLGELVRYHDALVDLDRLFGDIPILNGRERLGTVELTASSILGNVSNPFASVLDDSILETLAEYDITLPFLTDGKQMIKLALGESVDLVRIDAKLSDWLSEDTIDDLDLIKTSRGIETGLTNRRTLTDGFIVVGLLPIQYFVFLGYGFDMSVKLGLDSRGFTSEGRGGLEEGLYLDNFELKTFGSLSFAAGYGTQTQIIDNLKKLFPISQLVDVDANATIEITGELGMRYVYGRTDGKKAYLVRPEGQRPKLAVITTFDIRMHLVAFIVLEAKGMAADLIDEYGHHIETVGSTTKTVLEDVYNFFGALIGQKEKKDIIPDLELKKEYRAVHNVTLYQSPQAKFTTYVNM